jgi:hypothetical protein
MKKEEIILKQEQTKRLLGRFLWGVLVLAGVLAAVAGAASADHRALMGNIFIIILVTCVLAGIVWIGRLTDIRCPLCKKSIQGGIQTPLALTTGKCGHCGERIIDETEADWDRETPCGVPLPDHRTYGSRIRRLGWSSRGGVPKHLPNRVLVAFRTAPLKSIRTWVR